MKDDSLLIPAATVLGPIIAFMLWPFLSIFIHEFGHILAAKLVGLRPTHLIVGQPDWEDPIVSRRAFGVKIECWPFPVGGMTLLEAPPTNKLKAFIVTLGGPISDMLIILTAFQLWTHVSFRVILAIIIFSEATNLIYNLIPVSGVYDGVKVPRDGKVLLQILLGRLPRETPEI
jgi:membrane-associated protease RseP (regulator of RpoE activity)